MIKVRKLVCAASAAVLLGAGGLANAATTVFTELALLMDVSGSVDASEFNLQRNGYISAFHNSTLHNFIAATPGGIAVTLVQWSGVNQQAQIGGGVGGWYHLTNAADSIAFAAAIAGFNRAYSGLTAPGSALNFITPQFSSNAFDGQNWIIDVSGDGAQNDGANTATARNNALAAGVDRINGLAILGEAGLLAWYQNNIQGGSGSFTLAATFNNFDDVLIEKLRYEITNTVIPVPGALPLLASGLLAFGWLARRRKA